MLSFDSLKLARRQLAIDARRTDRFPHLLAHKAARMSISPLAFLRGSAPLFYELLKEHRALGDGPAGDGWLVGDAHLENFGAYRASPLSPEARRSNANERVVFDLNDFDDALIGPWRWDVLRLVTSMVLGGRETGADGQRTLELCDSMLDAYVGAVFLRKRTPAAPPAVDRLLEKVRLRTRRQLLDDRTRIVGNERRFLRGPRYLDLPRKLRAKAELAFAKYAKRLPEAERAAQGTLEPIDVAFRVAGTGSLGSLRVAVLTRGKGGRDGAWIFDMKEEDTPSAAVLVRPPRLDPAKRVLSAFQACVSHPPGMMGTTRLRGCSMFVRRLAPQEDKIDLAKIHSDDLEPLARHFGALLGAAHRRGATHVPKKPWSAKEQAILLSHAIDLAGVHESMYLAHCALVRP
jgi:uncharacterized protein (DUF2252 family)